MSPGDDVRGPSADRGPVAGRRFRVGVLFGGRSGEHEVSLQSAAAVMESLARAGYEVVPIGITREGRWLTSGDPMRALTSGEGRGERAVTMLPEPGLRALTAMDGPKPGSSLEQLDVIFPVLHGTYGEDGTVQGLLELAGIPYVGSGVLASAAGMNKAFQKRYWRGIGLPVVDWIGTSRREIAGDLDGVADRVERTLGYPCFTKPASLGSSVGVSKARDKAQLREGLRDAARYDAEVLVEKGVDARELEVSVLGNDDPVVSAVGEIIPNADFYSYRAKYLDSGSQTVIPAEIPSAVAEEVRRVAIEAFRSVHASGLARVDFFLERRTNQVFLNEINTMPGFTRISMYPKLWEASGLAFPDLVSRLIELALERHAQTASNRTDFDVGAAS